MVGDGVGWVVGERVVLPVGDGVRTVVAIDVVGLIERKTVCPVYVGWYVVGIVVGDGLG